LEIEREGGNGKVGGKILKVGVWIRQENAGVPDKRRDKKRKVERKGGKKSMRV